jgi:hypothetical protein
MQSLVLSWPNNSVLTQPKLNKILMLKHFLAEISPISPTPMSPLATDTSTLAPEAPRRARVSLYARRLVIALGALIMAVAPAFGQAPVFIKDVVFSDEASGVASGIKEVACGKEANIEHGKGCVAKIGDVVSLEVVNLSNWLEKLKADKVITSGETGNALVVEQLPNLSLFIDEHLMRSLHPTEYTKDDPLWYPNEPEQKKAAPGRSWLEFILKRDATDKVSRADWDPVLRTHGIAPKMQLAVGIYNANRNVAHVMALPEGAAKTEPRLKFELRLIAWEGWTVFGLILLLVATIVFLYMSIFSGMVRDTTCPVREDGLPPFSLGRCQMAFWFFLVISAFYFIWIITGRGDTDTINSTVLILIGISAGTALGSAIVGNSEAAAKADPTAPAGGAVSSQPAVVVYPVRIKAAQAALAQAKAAGDDARIKAQTIEVATLKRDLKRWRALHRWQLLLDLLSEQDTSKGENRVITFHRFQIVVWTLILGIIFVSEVLTKLAMPVFDATLLSLMGISSGTYLGFKVAK